MVVPVLTSSSGEVPIGARRKRSYSQALGVISPSLLLRTAEQLTADLGSQLCLFAEIQRPASFYLSQRVPALIHGCRPLPDFQMG